MIGLAKACSGGSALGNYVMDNEKGYELDRNLVCGESPKEIMHEMKFIQDLNQKATNKTFSLVLSPDIKDGQNLTDKDLKEMSREYLSRLGIDPVKQQFVAFVHTEKEHKHIHIIANRVKTDGKLISDHHIGKRSQWIAHEIAKERGLVSAKEKMFENIRSTEKTNNDLKGIKAEIFKKHQEVLKQNPKSFESYITQMDLRGLEVKPTINKQGEIQGFRIIDKESKNNFKASEINRSMSAANLIKNGISNNLKYNLDTTLRGVQNNKMSKNPVRKNLQFTIKKAINNEIKQVKTVGTNSVMKKVFKSKMTKEQYKEDLKFQNLQKIAVFDNMRIENENWNIKQKEEKVYKTKLDKQYQEDSKQEKIQNRDLEL